MIKQKTDKREQAIETVAAHSIEGLENMNSSRALELLSESKPTLAARYGVTHLALFGSTVRDAARSDSDVDVLAAFGGPATSARYFGVQLFVRLRYRSGYG